MNNQQQPLIPGLLIKHLNAWRDARGWNIHPLDEEKLAAGIVKNVHVVSMEPGTTRGNHKHTTQTEWVLIIGGPCLFVVENPENGQKFEKTFETDELCLISLSPGLAHVFKNLSNHTIHLLCASDTAFNSDSPDTTPHKLAD